MRAGDIYRLGAVSDYNRLNVHINIDASITRRLRARVRLFRRHDFPALPKYGYGTSNDDEMTAVLCGPTIRRSPFPVHVTPEALDESVEMEKNQAIWRRQPMEQQSRCGAFENGSTPPRGAPDWSPRSINMIVRRSPKGLKSTTFLGS